MNSSIARHFSAFKNELSGHYGFKPSFVFFDLTLGDGGHTEEALLAGCRVVSLEIDPEAIERAIGFISPQFTPLVIDPETFTGSVPQDFSWIIIRSNFIHLSSLVQKLSLPQIDGLIADLGPSQFQVLSPGRGFSFLLDEPLDMRLDKNLGVTAADLLAVLNEGELADLLALADEPFAKPLARVIVKQRQLSPITTTQQLSALVSRVKKARFPGRIHPATQVFMALRMVVNLERENIRLLLSQIPPLLSPNGLLGVISFHSGEDKLVKDFITEMEAKKILYAINKKPIEPSTKELSISQRTRSAKLRLAKKIT